MPTSPALWITGPSTARLKPATFETTDGMVEVETLYSGISRGTEALVFRGAVPESEWARMRCPLQEGDFPFPVKYGYAAVGIARGGDANLDGRPVFVLHPHQTRFAAPRSMVMPLPPEVPPARAVLAANMETALNIVWDARAAPGGRVAVVGAGVVGALTGWLVAQLPGAEVTLVDIDRGRAALAEALGCRFALPDACPTECDVVIHASASVAGLAIALNAAGMEATIVEASWYGDRPVDMMLGGAFHSKRLKLVSSQVGHVAERQRARWTHGRRLAKAIDLLADDRLEALISGETEFSDVPGRYGEILADPGTLCHRIRYTA